MKMNAKLLMAAMLVLALSGCATKVQRLEVEQPVDISGSWNDTDSRMVADQMIADCLSANWITDFLRENGKNPIVIVGTIVNRTDEHINPHVFVKDLERTFVRSGKVTVVASQNERREVRDEREDQLAGNTDPETISETGMETGADFMLKGNVSSIRDALERREVIFYQVDLELIDLSTNQKVWLGQKQIKKLIKTPRFSL